MSNLLPVTILGRTGLKVTRLGFGTALSRSGNAEWDDKAAANMMNQVLDHGINFIDTAYDYVDAERRIGEFISDRYNEFHLATKCGCTDSLPTQDNSNHLWTSENLFSGLEGSLKRLNRDSIEIMQLHNPTVEECESGGLVKALLEMKRSGKVKFIGVSTTLPHLPVFLEWDVFDVMQIPYSALERTHENWISRAAQKGVGIIVRGGVAHGEPGHGSGSEEQWDTFERAGLNELCSTNESRSGFVLRYTLSHPFVHTIIVGTTRQEHLTQNVETVLQGPLPEDVYQEAKKRLDSVGETASE